MRGVCLLVKKKIVGAAKALGVYWEKSGFL